jgi:hypothetical protein
MSPFVELSRRKGRIIVEALGFIKNVRKVVLNHYDELKRPFYGHEPDFTAVIFSEKTISEKYIHGGAGDRDIDRFICIKDGDWYIYEIETELTAIYEPRFQITGVNKDKMSDEGIENFLNSKRCSLEEVYSFIKRCNQIAASYPSELRGI